MPAYAGMTRKKESGTGGLPMQAWHVKKNLVLEDCLRRHEFKKIGVIEVFLCKREKV